MFAIFKNRNFSLLWLGQVISMCGDFFMYIAVPYFVYQLTGSVLQTGITVIAETLPRVLLSSLAGVFVDRWNRRWTMLTADLLRAVVLLLMLLVHSADQLWLIYVAIATQAIISQFFTPASMALIPSLVEQEQLMAANSLSSLGQSITRLIGPAVGGILFTALGLTGTVLMDSATYVFSALMILCLSLPTSASVNKATEQKERVTVGAAVKHLWEEWAAGLRLIRGSQTLVGIFVTMCVFMLGQGIIQVMFVIFVRNVIHGDAMIYAWILTSQGIGSILGALLNGVFSKWLRPGYQIALGGLVSGGAILAVISFPDPIIAMILTGIVGVFSVGFIITLYTLLQTGAEDRYRGRVFGTLETVMSLATLISMTLSSSFGDSLGAILWMAISGTLILVSGGIALFILRQARLPQAEQPTVEKDLELSL
ncbi:MFS transporter [Ktedonospora formicarum]|uniref:MFS transporter n=1 Tax=Ktedonospora formicarum TaxID=2778364 RepID=A0A8J3I9V7_9CHLR|nr:MFS transporter [Ktedonospora formicarum]GHO49470.1 MFS transporter [Ktedonospora formicarum]